MRTGDGKSEMTLMCIPGHAVILYKPLLHNRKFKSTLKYNSPSICTHCTTPLILCKKTEMMLNYPFHVIYEKSIVTLRYKQIMLQILSLTTLNYTFAII